MARSISLPVPVTHSPAAPLAAAAQAAAVPWYVWCSTAAVTLAMIGGHWDISWHRSIGRDAFLTPAHIAIYLCGILAGVSCAYMILATTLGRLPELEAASVKMWGFRGPLGAFISAWGGVAMITSAPFDNWWHNAYGLDVKVLSPPHTLLILGVFAVELGTLILILGAMNRAQGRRREPLERLYLYVGGMLLALILVLLFEYTFRTAYHSGLFYLVMSVAIPPVMVGVATGSAHRWAATYSAAVYTAFMAGLCWVLPLFPAAPKLGPVYHQVHQFVPPPFPLLILAPAIVLDLLRARTRAWNPVLRALVYGIAFLATFLAVQWPFADFLMSPGARNWIFGSGFYDYLTPRDSALYRNVFAAIDSGTGQFGERLAWAAAWAVAMSGLGLAWGSWMRRLRR